MKNLLALSVRQPYAEQIMRGTKKIEFRSLPTRIRGRVYIYAGQKPGNKWSFAGMRARPGDFPSGVLIGTVEVKGCTGQPGDYRWHLAKPMRLTRPVRVERQPTPVWFYPFKARG